MGAPQIEHTKQQIELQTPAGEGVKPWHIGTLVALGTCALIVTTYPVIFLFVAGGAIVAFVAYRLHIAAWERKEAMAVATSYACICGPELIVAIHPNESIQEMQDRANDFRQKLRDSGNYYWQVIPIEVFPYTPVLSQPGHLSTSWNTYKVNALTRQYEANMAWLNSGCPAQLRGVFASQVMKIVEQPAQQ